jgi:hypothetical protein
MNGEQGERKAGGGGQSGMRLETLAGVENMSSFENLELYLEGRRRH